MSPIDASYRVPFTHPAFGNAAGSQASPASIWARREAESAIRARNRAEAERLVRTGKGRAVTGEERYWANSDEGEIERLREALRLAGIRLGICADRMRGCHEETGQHALLAEVEMFESEARAALAQPSRSPMRSSGQGRRSGGNADTEDHQ